MIKEESVLRDIDFVLCKASQTENGLVQVLKTARAIVGPSRSLQRRYDDRTVIATDSIRRCVKAYLKFRVYKLGDRFLIQNCGIPTGGFLSSALLGLVCASCETKFDAHRWQKYCREWGIDGPRHRWIGTGRYEDDAFGTSNAVCPTCVQRVLTDTYRDELPVAPCLGHEHAEGGTTMNEFLDMHITLTFTSCSIDLYNANAAYALTGVASDPIHFKYRFPPPVGSAKTVSSRLCQNFMCRRARWAQLRLDPRMMQRASLLDFLELARYGYSFPMVRRSWMASKSHDAGFGIGALVINLARPFFRSSCNWPSLPRPVLDSLEHIFRIDAERLVQDLTFTS